MTEWIMRYIPRVQWREYEVTEEKSGLSPHTLREWYEAGASEAPEHFGIFLCVSVRPDGFYLYARTVARIAFGEHFARYFRVAAIPFGVRASESGWPTLAEYEWTLVAGPRDDYGGLHRYGRAVELPDAPTEHAELAEEEPPVNAQTVHVQQNEGADVGEERFRFCEVCGISIQGKRPHARTCSAVCRKRKMLRERQEQAQDGASVAS